MGENPPISPIQPSNDGRDRKRRTSMGRRIRKSVDMGLSSTVGIDKQGKRGKEGVNAGFRGGLEVD